MCSMAHQFSLENCLGRHPYHKSLPICLSIAPSFGAFGAVYFRWSIFFVLVWKSNWSHFSLEIVSSFQDFTKVMGFLSSCSHMDYRERKKSAGFENTLGNLSSVWDSSSFLVASWSKCDCSLSSYSFESICCNLRLILHSHENDPCFSLLIYT